MSSTNTFGLSSTRVDDDVADELMDALDEAAEGEWELVSWRRSAGTRFIVTAPVRCRGVVDEPHLHLRLRPMGSMVGDMEDPRNEWIIPEPDGDASPHDQASSQVSSWMGSMWSPSGSEEAEPEGESPSGRRLSVVKGEGDKPSASVLRAFGLTGDETGSDGSRFDLKVLGD